MVKLKYWQIITLGAVATIASVVVVSLLAMILYGVAAPAGLWWLAVILHLGALMAVFTWIPKPFIDAYWSKRYEEAMDRLLAAFSGAMDHGDPEHG